MAAEASISFIVIVKDPLTDPKGLGERRFRVAPRVGEYVAMDNPDGVGIVYRVKAVIHPLELTTTAGDLIVESAGDEIDLLRSL